MDLNDENITRINSRRIIAKIIGRHFKARGKFRIATLDGEHAGESNFVGHDPDAGVIVVDALPSVEGRHVEMADRVEVRGVLDSLLTWFYSGGMTVHAEGKDRYYHVPYPDELYRLQRRNAFRITLPVTMDSGVVALVPNDIRQVSARLHDLSATGAGVLLDEVEAAYFEPGMRVESAMLQVEELLDIKLNLEVRNKRPGPRESEVIVGVAFVDMDPSNAHALQRAVMEIQRTSLLALR